MKRKLAIILVAVLVFGLSILGVTSQNRAYAKTAQIHLEIPDSVNKENVFNVTVVLESDVQLYSIDAYLSYNPEVLEFVPNSGYITGADGILELKDTYAEETKKASYEITFKAIDTGMVEVALTDVYLIDYADMDYITVTSSAKQFEIGINKTVAEDARLSELIVAPGEFTEGFEPNQLEYEMHVGLDVDSIGVSAIPVDEDSIVGLEMPDKLKVGKNIIKIKVTALSGNVNEYTIIVIREENATTEETVTEQMIETDTTESSELSVETEITQNNKIQ